MRGTLEIITGPMWAGKSSELIRRLQLAEADGWKIQAFRPAVDTRHRGNFLLSHDGFRAPAVSVAAAEEILEHLQPDTDVVGIDEVHMMPQRLTKVCRQIAAHGIRVIVSGLDTDHFGKPFDPMPRLLCEADHVAKMRGACESCQGPSRYSQRLVRSDARILPGGEGVYEPRCRACFVPALPVSDAKALAEADIPVRSVA